MTRRLCWLPFLLASLTLPTIATAGPPTLEVRVHQLMTNQSLRPLLSGASLHSGDWVGFSVRVNQPAYVYVAQIFTDGSAAVHFPEGSGDLLLQPGLELPIPGGGELFQLDDVVGEERVYFIASERPLGNADARIAAALDLIHTRGAPSEGEPRGGTGSQPSDDFGMPDRRGLVKKRPTFVEVTADSGGVAVFSFIIRHLSR